MAIHRCRTDKTGGGTTILVHDSVRLERVLDVPFSDSFESTSIFVKYKANSISVSEVYRPLNSNDNLFLEGLQLLLGKTAESKLQLICGDFNYDLIKLHQHKPTSNFLSKMLDNQLAPYVLKPTRITHKTSTLIDNIFVKSLSDKLVKNSFVITDCMSDHFPCLLSLSMCTKKPKRKLLCVNTS